jgi:stalled ribosome alternative rescue factor ArfA
MSYKRKRKEVKIQEFRYRDTKNVELEMYDYTSYNWSHWNSNEKLKGKPGSYTRKIFDRFTTENSYTWNITHDTESTAVLNLKPEWWGSPLVQETYRDEKACDGQQE